MKKRTLGSFYLFIFAYIALQVSLFQINDEIDFYSLYFKFIITITLFFLLINLHKVNHNRYEHRYLLSGFFFLFLTMLTNALNELFIQPWLITSLFEDIGQAIGYVLIFHAVNRWTAQTKEQTGEQWKRLETDELTSLYSRRHFNVVLAEKCTDQKNNSDSFSLLLINIDNFKAINEQYAQLAGDLVLKRLGNKLRDCIQKSDVVARWEGDEFIVLLTGSNEAIANQIADAIRAKIQLLCIEFHQDILNVTVSIGGSTYQMGMSSADLINKAEQGLSTAKQSGKNKVVIVSK